MQANIPQAGERSGQQEQHHDDGTTSTNSVTPAEQTPGYSQAKDIVLTSVRSPKFV